MWRISILQYGLLKYFYNQHPCIYGSFFKNQVKAKYYGWYFIYRTLTWLQTYLTYQSNSITHTLSLYEHEKGIYLYDLIECIIKHDWIYLYHHLITFLLIFESERIGLQSQCIQVMYFMNSTQPFFYTTRLLRHLNDSSYIIYGDTVFLLSFSYFRIWKYGQFIYQYSNSGMILLVVALSMYLLQWIWFIKLIQLYIKKKNQSNYPQYLFWKSLNVRVYRIFRGLNSNGNILNIKKM